MDLQAVENFWTNYLSILGNQLNIDLYLINQNLIASSSLKKRPFCHHKKSMASVCTKCILNHYTTDKTSHSLLCLTKVYSIPLPPELNCILIIKYNEPDLCPVNNHDKNLSYEGTINIQTEEAKITQLINFIDFLVNNVFPIIILNQNSKLLFENILSPFLKKNNLNSSKEIIATITDAIKKNPEKDYSLKSLSHLYHISQGYLSTKFKKYNGISLKKFIVKHRITKSKHLLESTCLTIEEIALKSGFSDSCYFHRIFKKETGYTPLKFKKISLK